MSEKYTVEITTRNSFEYNGYMIVVREGERGHVGKVIEEIPITTNEIYHAIKDKRREVVVDNLYNYINDVLLSYIPGVLRVQEATGKIMDYFKCKCPGPGEYDVVLRKKE